MMRSFDLRRLLFCLVPGLLLFISSCTVQLTSDTVEPRPTGGPPRHAPAHGYRRHAYVYYPSSYVYFDTTRKVYFYMTSGAWKMSVKLPSSVTINLREGVSMTLDTNSPHTYFSTHKKKYPPGQLKKRYTQGHTKREQPPGKGKGKGRSKGKNKDKKN